VRFNSKKPYKMIYGRGRHPIKMSIIEQGGTWFLTDFERRNMWMRDELVDEG